MMQTLWGTGCARAVFTSYAGMATSVSSAVAFAPDSLPDAVLFPDLLFEIELGECVDRTFFWCLWNSAAVRQEIQAPCRTAAGIFKINTRNLNTLLLRFPHIDEQKRIAADLSHRLSESDRLAGRIREELATSKLSPRRSFLARRSGWRQWRAAMGEAVQPWQPTTVSLPSEPIFTDTKPVAVVTDLDIAYLKPLWTPQSGNWLVREMIGLRLARALGLDAPRCAVYELSAEEAPEDRDGEIAGAGPALLVEKIEWVYWDGTPATLARVSNRSDLAGLVILDTWLRNTDRYPPYVVGGDGPNPERSNLQNVALSRDPQRRNRFRIRAVDYSRALHPGFELEAQKLGGMRSRIAVSSGSSPRLAG